MGPQAHLAGRAREEVAPLLTPPAGYSGTPLARKLGIKAGCVVHAAGAPEHYASLLAPLPEGVRFAARASAQVHVVHAFHRQREALATALVRYRAQLAPAASLWVSWPKKAARVETDLTEDTVRELALPLGYVDVKVCAVDAVWSGLKLVLRKELR
jgi:hypothetical protein